MGNGTWTTDKTTEYRNVRVVGDAKYFPESGDKGAATFLTIVDGTKGGEDLYVDCKVAFGAEKAGGLKKGQEISVRGTVEWKVDEKTGKLKGKIWNAQISYSKATRDALAAALVGSAEAAAPPPAAPADSEAPTSEAPAFD